MLRRRWYLVAAGIVFGCVFGGLIGLIVPPTYTAQATLYFSATANGTSGTALSATDANLLAQQQVTSISLLASTERVARNVIDDLNLPLTTNQLESKISAVSDPATVILVVSARDSSSERAADIANATAKALSELADKINRQAVADQLPSVVANVIQPAVAPPFASSGTTRLNLLGGVTAGFLLGIAAALVVGALDRSVRTGSELAELTGAPVIGGLSHDNTVGTHPLTVDEHPDSELAESYRRLRLGLEPLLNKRIVVMMTSAGRSEGRTTAVCNLALAFAESGLGVAVLEADLRNPRVADYLGLESAAGLSDVLAGEAAVPDVIRNWCGKFDVVLAGRSSSSPGRLLASAVLTDVIGKLRRDHDVVIVDTPAALGFSDALAVATAADAVVLVARYGKTQKGDVREAVHILEVGSVEPDACFLTGIRPAPWIVWKRPSKPTVLVEPANTVETGWRPTEDEPTSVPPPVAAAGNGDEESLPNEHLQPLDAATAASQR
jgi:capsular exopolysaccharide synthesis family protein